MWCVTDMASKKENKKILAETKRIRRTQILSSFDIVFIILLPIAVFISGYTATRPEVLIRFDPQFLHTIFIIVFVIPLFTGIIGILKDSIEYRLMGWYIFFISGIFSILSYPLFFYYQNVAETAVWQVYFFFGIGSLFIGIGAGDLFLEKIFLDSLFLPRMREVGITRTKIKARKFPNIVLCALTIFGIILVLIGMLVIPGP